MLRVTPLFILLILVCPTLKADDSLPEIKLCSQNEPLLPYIASSSEDIQQPGILVEIVKQAARASGFKPVIIRRPWKRCIHNLKTGKIDALFAVVWQAERDNWGHFPKDAHGELLREQRLWSAVYSIFTHKESTLTWDGRHVDNIKTGIASPLGYVVHQQIQDMGIANHTNLSVREGFRLLSLNRLDGYVIEEYAGDQEIKLNDTRKTIRKMPEPFYVSDWYMPLSYQFVKKHPHRSQLLWQKMSEIRHTQKQALIKKYMNEL